MGAVIDLTDQEWDQVADLFDRLGDGVRPKSIPAG